MNDTDKSAFYPIIAIEGNIGAGKSTFLNWIIRNTGAVCFEELLSGFLPSYLKDVKRWAFTLQVDTLKSRVHALNKAWEISKHSPVFIDRSVYGDYAFALANWRQGNMSSIEFKTYEDVYKTFGFTAPDAIIYLDTSPSVCLERIKKRARGGEACTEYAYLAEVARAHDEVLERAESRGVLVYRVDWSDDLQASQLNSKIDTTLSSLQSKIEDKLNAQG